MRAAQTLCNRGHERPPGKHCPTCQADAYRAIKADPQAYAEYLKQKRDQDKRRRRTAKGKEKKKQYNRTKLAKLLSKPGEREKMMERLADLKAKHPKKTLAQRRAESAARLVMAAELLAREEKHGYRRMG